MTETSNLYHNFFGVDIAKFDFVVAHTSSCKTESFSNDLEGFEHFFAKYGKDLRNSLLVLENTGGCEYALISFLLDKNIAVHRADARKVKAFIRSFGRLAKTDSIDAHGLCKYAQERHNSLICLHKEDENLKSLRSLIARRNDLVQIQTAEKNRLKAPENQRVLPGIDKHLAFLSEEINAIDSDISELIAAKKELKGQLDVLQTIPGIGKITAHNLIAFVPELGHIDRRGIASLLGVAPICRDSGKSRGYRGTWGGRNNVRTKLFTAAMAAAKSNSPLGEYYKNMINRGKHKMVAIVALMRKIIIIANAKLRDYKELQQILKIQHNHS